MPIADKIPTRPNLFSRLTGAAPLQAEAARLRAFLAAVPGAWCGFATDGTVAYSDSFCRLLGLDAIAALSDVQGKLFPSDAAALEGQFQALQENGLTFASTVHNADKSIVFSLRGTRGADAESGTRFDMLWLEDVTPQQREQRREAQLRESAETERDRLLGVLDRLPYPIWLRGPRGDIAWCNRLYADLLGTTPATVVAERRELALKPARRNAGKPVLPLGGRALAELAREQGGPAIVQAHIIAAGQRRLLQISETPLGLDGNTLGLAQDITREEELEAELHRYMAANTELLEQLGTAIAIFDGGQRLAFYNSAFAQLWKLDDNYLNGKPKLGDLMEKLRETRLLPEQADFRKYKQSWLALFTGLLQPHEEMLYLPSGSALRMLVVPHSMGGLMMTFEDVTSRLELESSYNTLIAVQRETLDNLAEGVAVFSGDGRLRLSNPSFAKLWELNPEDLEGGPHIMRLSEKMKGSFEADEWPVAQKTLIAQSLDRTAHGGRLARTDGSLLSYSTVPLPDGGVLVTHVDISDTARVENALREKNAALETAERLKLDFLANVSYQLRTPLSAIMGFTEILNNEYFGPLNARQREYTSGMHEAGERLLSLIDDILDLSSIEAGYMVLNREAVPVRRVMDTIADLTRDWARKDQIEVRLTCPADIGEVVADERRLKQALLNLVSNAISFSPLGSTIELNAKRQAGTVYIAVSDKGPGISSEDQNRIFEPFERARGGQAGRGRGAGLGLALVRNIVKLHGGQIRLESREGRGTTFTISLPAETVLSEARKAAETRAR